MGKPSVRHQKLSRKLAPRYHEHRAHRGDDKDFEMTETTQASLTRLVTVFLFVMMQMEEQS